MRRFSKIALACAVLIVLLFYILNPPPVTPTGTQSVALYQPGELGLKRETLRLTDSSRLTMANDGFRGQPFRELNGKVAFPELSSPEQGGQGPYPLIVYSHGFMSSVREADYLEEFLVPKGYIVAAVNYPLSNWRSPGGPTIVDVVNQPGDISFVIDNLLARNATVGDSLYGLVDPERIAVVGLSLGGLTSQLAAFHRDLRDPRVAAVISIAGPTAFLMPEFFRTAAVPFMLIAGTSDAVIPYQIHAAPIPDKVSQSVLVTLEGGSHFGFARSAVTFLRWARHPDQLVCPLLLQGLENGTQLREAMTPTNSESGISSEIFMPCSMAEYPRAMRPGQQRMLTRLAVYAFLESVFARESARQTTMETFLFRDLPREQPSVSLSM